MRRAVTVCLTCLIAAVFVITAWQFLEDDAGIFDSENVLVSDASQLKATTVSAHLAEPVTKGFNIVWCGTFQLVWIDIVELLVTAD